MQKKKVAILFGGCSSEYEVSLQSAYAVIRNINKEKYEPVLIGITKEGKWYRYYGKTSKISDNTWHKDVNNCFEVIFSPDRGANKLIEFNKDKIAKTVIDCAFPVLHGKFGEDGTVQGLIELAGIALVGCNTLSSALCMDKDRAHKIAAFEGVKTPKSIVINKCDTKNEIIRKMQKLNYSLFVKPVKAGSSFGISKITHKKHLEQAVINAFLYDDEVIIEENIDGAEVGCAVLGNDVLTVGRVDEIELAGGFFDYDEKYTLKTSKIHMPARIDEETEEKIKQTAKIIYRALGCCGFARVDMFLTPNKEIIFNEVNTIPGFTSRSRYPNMMRGIGLEFEDIIDKLITLSFQK